MFFLFLVLFNLTSRSHFRSDFGDQPINLFTLLCATEWGINHNSIITLCRVTSQYVKAVFFEKIDFSKIELKFPIFRFSYKTKLNAKTCCDRCQILYEVSKHKIGKFIKIRESQGIINYLFTAKTRKIRYFKRKITAFTYWLVTLHLVVIQLWFIPRSIAHDNVKRLIGRSTKSDLK